MGVPLVPHTRDIHVPLLGCRKQVHASGLAGGVTPQAVRARFFLGAEGRPRRRCLVHLVMRPDAVFTCTAF